MGDVLNLVLMEKNNKNSVNKYPNVDCSSIGLIEFGLPKKKEHLFFFSPG
jgi:hypothetical protein